MVKFSRLYSRILHIKSKKTKESSAETMHKKLEDCFQNDAKSSQGDFLEERCARSEGNNSKHDSEHEIGVPSSGNIRKSISLGNDMAREGNNSVGSDSENEKRDIYDETMVTEGVEQLAISPSNQSDSENKESVSSIGNATQYSKDDCNISDLHFSQKSACASNDGTPISLPPSVVKSKSLYDICLSPQNLVVPHSRSAEDLTSLDLKRMNMDDNISNKVENIDVNTTNGGCDSYEHFGPAKEWIVPVKDETYADKHFHGESSSCNLEDIPSKDYRIKRIEDWVSDLKHCSPLEETDDDDVSNVDYNQILGGANSVDYATSSKISDKLNPGVEVAKRYISSLSPIATTANLTNHGLVVVPLLSAFVSLRTLNLSGNFIVKITAGSLPRGLHALNLSKNNITTIEGLRELTRLRVLDLSYNRIVRIGHGLASCSSIKELYLAGNKISEVEGLHRLLKLNVLDLRFNKISTAKSLGQLAANYNSLQAISLEGNPAQKNVGDENLKKYLQSLLPQLSYYNRHSIKTKSLNDMSDRSARLGISSNRGLRSDHKNVRKGNAHNKSISSSVHGSRNQSALPISSKKSVLLKPSKGKSARLPPTGSKGVKAHKNHFYDFGSKILSLGSDNLMRRSHSEGTLGAL